MKLDLLVLDWSGVVSDDFGLVHASVNEIMAYFSMPPVAEEELRTDFRPNLGDFYAARGVSDYETVKRLHLDFFRNSREKPEVIPGAADAVRELSRHVRIAVFSSHPEQELLGDIWRYGLQEHIAHALGSAHKADSRDFEHLLEMAGASRDGVFYAGDTTIDVALMHREGIKGIAVAHPKYGYQRREQIAAYRPQPSHGIITHLHELLPVIQNGF